MTDGQNARSLLQALQGGDGGDAQNARTLAQVLQGGDGGDAQNARSVVQVLQEVRYEGTIAGVATVTGHLFAFDGLSDGVGVVTGDLDNIQTDARSGRTAVQVAVTVPTSLLHSRSGRTAVQVAVSWIPHDLVGSPAGQTTITNAFLSLSDINMFTASAGVATVTGTIDDPGPVVYLTPGTNTFTVPDYVYALEIKVWGAGGGGGGGRLWEQAGNGAGGSFATGTVPVTPGEVLDVFVGGGGDGGFGGNALNTSGGGGGGGYSGIKRTPAVLAIAGAGGGGAPDAAFLGPTRGAGGPGGKSIGLPGTGYGATSPGQGGHQTFGGAGGTDGSPDADDGSSFQGGDATGTGSAGGVTGGGEGGRDAESGGRAGGGGGAGIFGGGGGGSWGGGGGGPSTLGTTVSGTSTTIEAGASRIGAGQYDSDWPGAGYGNGGIGGVSGGWVDGDDGEGGAVWVWWEYTRTFQLPAEVVNGVATVQGTLDPLNPGIIPVPIPVDLLVSAGEIHDLDAVSAGQAAVAGWLKLVDKIAADSDGTATVTGSLDNVITDWSGTSNGTSTVLATLQNGTGGVYPNELAGQSDGVATVGLVHDIKGTSPMEQKRHLYEYVNVGVAFDDTDTHNGNGTVVSYNYPDGDIHLDFKRFLMQLINVGVAFDDTDNVDTRTINSLNPYVTTPAISQNFPDGDIHLDWGRHLYQFLQVVEGYFPTGRLTIGPTPHRDTFHPYAKPPTSSVRVRGPVKTGPRRTTTPKTPDRFPGRPY